MLGSGHRRWRATARTQTFALVAVVGLALAVNVGLLLGRPAPSPAVERADRTSGVPRGGEMGPTSGAGLTEPGVRLRAQVEPDGDLLVSERLLLDGPATMLTLRPPVLAESNTGRAVLDEVAIRAGGRPVPGPVEPVATAWSTALPEGTLAVSLRYRVTDAATTGADLEPGRTLTRLAPATYGSSDDLPVVVDVEGGSVLLVTCPRVPLAERRCGRLADGRWTTGTLPAARGVVLIEARTG